jgi:adenylate kinase
MENTDQTKKRIILVIGPPGSGKGTQCEILAKKTGLTHISVGDMIREAIKNQTELGKLAEPFASNNSLVPDVIINDVVIERLTRNSNEGIILDGFPRTLNQALALHSNNAMILKSKEC